MAKSTKRSLASIPRRLDQTVIFDRDDTLWETQTLYDKAKSAFARELEREGYSPKEALVLLTEIDLENVRKMGFSRHRFPKSLVATYDTMSKAAGNKPNARIRRKIAAFGRSVFEQPPRLIAGAKSLLNELRGKARLVLMTAGDTVIQRRRIKTSGLKQYFDVIDIPKLKTPTEFRRLVKQLKVRPADTWMVGNSMKSDILPAYKVGLQTVWVSGRGWAYDLGSEMGQPVAKAPNLQKVREILRRRLGRF